MQSRSDNSKSSFITSGWTICAEKDVLANVSLTNG
jgi:hypothetical protein